MFKKILIQISIILSFISVVMCKNNVEGQKVKISTTEGDIYVVLYDNTPIYKKDFIEKITEGRYNGISFHRVIEDFMIQAGEKPGGKKTKSKEEEVQLPAEIVFPQYFHKAGALAAARWGDDVNPEKKSDLLQFYIVTGRRFSDNELVMLDKERFERFKQQLFKEAQVEMRDSIKALYREGNKQAMMQLKADMIERVSKEAEERKQETMYTDAHREAYKTIGGAPHLDGEYTVFGEVYNGMEVVKKINKAEVNAGDRPIKDIIVTSVELID